MGIIIIIIGENVTILSCFLFYFIIITQKVWLQYTCSASRWSQPGIKSCKINRLSKNTDLHRAQPVTTCTPPPLFFTVEKSHGLLGKSYTVHDSRNHIKVHPNSSLLSMSSSIFVNKQMNVNTCFVAQFCPTFSKIPIFLVRVPDILTKGFGFASMAVLLITVRETNYKSVTIVHFHLAGDKCCLLYFT